MKKDNLILIPGFSSNRYVLKGLLEVMSQYLNVHFIELPGFVSDVSPLSEITLSNFAVYVQKEIEKLDLDEYLIGGISLGFTILSDLELDQRCKGVLALEPHFNKRSLNLNWFQKNLYLATFRTICFFKLYNLLWKTRLFKTLFAKFTGLPDDIIKIILDQNDPRTFFATAKMGFQIKKMPQFFDLPYVLIMNKEDEMVDYSYVSRQLKDNVRDFLFIEVQEKHFPPDLSKEYIEKKFPKEKIQKILEFFNNDSR